MPEQRGVVQLGREREDATDSRVGPTACPRVLVFLHWYFFIYLFFLKILLGMRINSSTRRSTVSAAYTQYWYFCPSFLLYLFSQL